MEGSKDSVIVDFKNSSVDYLLASLKDYFAEDATFAYAFINKCRKTFTEEEVKLIIKAYKIASDLHKGVRRASGEPYITHPIRVAYIVLDEIFLIDANSVCAALLHDTIEDTTIDENYIIKEFNEDIANLVVGVTKITDSNFASKTEKEQYNTCILIRSLMRDIRVILIKLADRLHNMRTLEYKSDKKQIEKSRETVSLFVPLAEHVGASVIKDELDTIAMTYLNRSEYLDIKANLDNYILRNQEVIEEFLNKLTNYLLEQGIDHEITMKRKSIPNLARGHIAKISTIPDLLSYNVVVDDLEDCYKVLDIFRKLFSLTEESIIDFIKIPKANGYKAIHLIVRGLRKRPIEITICSKNMDLINKYGLAALTKINPSIPFKVIQESLNKSNKFIAALQNIDDLYKNNKLFIKQIESELLSPQIQVCSKDNEVFSLPKGASVLDFAYKVHSEVGNSTIGALVNGVEVPRDYVLSDNDIIIILTDEFQKMQDAKYTKCVVTAGAKKKMSEARRVRKL